MDFPINALLPIQHVKQNQYFLQYIKNVIYWYICAIVSRERIIDSNDFAFCITGILIGLFVSRIQSQGSFGRLVSRNFAYYNI